MGDVEELGFWWDDGTMVLFSKRSLCLFETHAEVSMGEMMCYLGFAWKESEGSRRRSDWSCSGNSSTGVDHCGS